MMYETRLRSAAKAVSWRLVGALTTMAVVFGLTGRLDLTVSVGLLDTLIKIALYFVHERGWNALRWGRRTADPFVVWFTGLSGSGKSTIAERVHRALSERGMRVEYLDGDGIRRLFPDTGFSREDRDRHIRRVGHLASTLEKNGVCVIASFISPYAESRRFVRGLCRNFVEVHVSTPLEVCERRDPKGLYALARKGEKPHFTGIDDPYEAPENSELSLNAAELSADEAAARVLEYLDRRRLRGSA